MTAKPRTQNSQVQDSHIQPATSQLGGVVVGIDGSESSLQALDWAANNWGGTTTIHPVMVYQVNMLGIEPPGLYRSISDAFREDARLGLESALANRAHMVDEARLMRGASGPGLVEASRQAALLVVGSRGRGAVSETLLGSVGSYCVKHAECPVAVVPPGTDPGSTLDSVVVGIDGSVNCVAALRWAVANTKAGGTIQAVACWAPTMLDVPLSEDELELSTSALLTSTIDRVLAERKQDSAGDRTFPAIKPVVERGDPRHVLRRLAGAADAVVVGARGHRGVPYLLLGSVATSLTHHPTTVSVVVR